MLNNTIAPDLRQYQVVLVVLGVVVTSCESSGLVVLVILLV